MVISPEYPGLEVKVCVVGQQLHEYDDEDATLKTITKYIEARSDCKFVVTAIFRPPFSTRYHVRAQLSIDGVSVAKTFCEREKLLQKQIEMSGHRSQRNGEWVKQDFCFAKLNIVEEAHGPVPSAAVLKQTLSTKGRITIAFQFIESYQDLGLDPRPPSNRRHELEALKEIPEKALKGDALSHQAVLSAPRTCHAGSFSFPGRHYKFVDQEPFATFHFKYRSLASLKTLRILKITEPTSVPLEDRPEEDLTPAELRELLRRVRQREGESESIKQEVSTTARVKRERTIDDKDDVIYVETRQSKRPRMDQTVIMID
ncbi:hypothetical protein CC77DRAFT_1096792 [Alternaria alternata]|uniref:DUF7918 domain-containing protein n=1 Tax=Alternaria alternata TaxID=5599 RepID=A0A177DG25_ALTAL|nr:hypothetical protein CC77DRAFT_1096792 [Alternaria alternata]OAG18217.1 hypothetical protein CC77DRAFT_1096792 [Alternaria alternata]